MGCSTGTVKSTASRALAKFRINPAILHASPKRITNA